jgi:hypothetical protein
MNDRPKFTSKDAVEKFVLAEVESARGGCDNMEDFRDELIRRSKNDDRLRCILESAGASALIEMAGYGEAEFKFLSKYY